MLTLKKQDTKAHSQDFSASIMLNLEQKHKTQPVTCSFLYIKDAFGSNRGVWRHNCVSGYWYKNSEETQKEQKQPTDLNTHTTVGMTFINKHGLAMTLWTWEVFWTKYFYFKWLR